MIERWRVVVLCASAFAGGVFVRAGDGFLLGVFVAALTSALLLGWWIGRADLADRDRERRGVSREIERHRAQLEVAGEMRSASTGSLRFTGPVGDRHPALFTRYDPEADERPDQQPEPRWKRTR